MKTRNLFLMLLALFCSLDAIAAIYRYVDESGRTVYSQSPPKTGQANEIKLPPTPPSSSSDSQVEQIPGTQAKDEQADTRRALSDKILAENCAKARKALDGFNNPRNNLIKTADGLYEQMTDEKRTQGIENAKQNIKEYCR